ncbi:MAG: glutamate 5-kinase [Planctomycetota bacterium]
MTAEIRKQLLQEAETLVVKVGSRVLTDSQKRLDLGRLEQLGAQLCELANRGKKVVLVSSGAVAAGMGKLNLEQRPADLAVLQAVASVGQAHLIQTYEAVLARHNYHAAQVLLTAEDLDDRKRYLNLRNTIVALLGMKVIPVVNENDAVSVDELLTTFGDNDRLAAMVAGLFKTPALIILSDVDGLFDTSAEVNESGEFPILTSIERINDHVLTLASAKSAVSSKSIGSGLGSELGKGGMASKLRAAQFVTRSGAPTIIAGGKTPNVLTRLADGEVLGTLFQPESRGLAPKKRWIGYTAQISGRILCDHGATQALKKTGPSLLAIGVHSIEGSFDKGDIVAICDYEGNEFARGLTNYGSQELAQIQGLQSNQIQSKLGHCPYEEVIHRDNIAML